MTEGSAVPKPLTPLLGTPLIDRLISLFTKSGAEEIHVIVNEQSPAVVQHLSGLRSVRLTVRDTESSLHSFAHLIRGGIPDEVCLTTVDTVFDPSEFMDMIRSFENRKELDGLMAVTAFVDDEKPLYVRTDDHLKILSFDDTRQEGTRFVSGGVYCLRGRAIERALKAVEKGMNRMRNFQRDLLAAGLNIGAFPFSKIVDVDHLADIPVAEELVRMAVSNQPPKNRSSYESR